MDPGLKLTFTDIEMIIQSGLIFEKEEHELHEYLGLITTYRIKETSEHLRIGRMQNLILEILKNRRENHEKLSATFLGWAAIIVACTTLFIEIAETLTLNL